MAHADTPRNSAHKYPRTFARTTQQLLTAAALVTLGGAPDADALDRTWIGGNADWNALSSNWNPLDEPDADDVAIFNTNNTVDLGIDNLVAGLTMSGGIDLFTDTFFLDVDGFVSISGNSSLNVGGNNIAAPANGLDAEDLFIQNNATLNLGGSRIDLAKPGVEGLILINGGGTLYGNGTLNSNDLAAGTFTFLSNSGTLRVGNFNKGLTVIGTPPARTLAITAADAADARVDLDGSLENGVVDVTRNATLDIDVTLSDAFDGTINLAHNATLDIANNWTLGGGGVINADTGFVPSGGIGFPAIPADTASITGGLLTQFGGMIRVLDDPDGAGTLEIASGFTGNGGVLDVGDGGTLRLTTLSKNFNAGHTLSLGNESQVVLDDGASVTFRNDDFDADGAGGADWTIRNGARANWYADNLGAFGSDIYFGVLFFQDDTPGGPDQILDIDVADGAATLGNIQVQSGTARIKSADHDDITIRLGAHVLSGAKLVLDSNRIEFAVSGALTGDGEAFFDQPVWVMDDTTFAVAGLDIDNVNGSLRIEPDATLTLTSDTIETVNSLFQINGGTAVVSTSYSFGTGGSLVLSEAFTSTSPVYTGAGTPTFLTGSSLLVSSDSADFASHGVFREGSSIDLFSNNSRLILGDTGKTVELNGGDVTSTGSNTRLTPQGTLLVSGSSSIDAHTLDWDGGATTINSGGLLTIDVTNLDVTDDTYNSVLTFNGGIVDVTVGDGAWVFEGTLNASGINNILRGASTVEIGDDTGVSDSNINVNAGIMKIQAAAVVHSDADVFVDAGATLLFENPNTVFRPTQAGNNAEFTGKGTLLIVGAEFAEATTLNMTSGTVGFDGPQVGGIFAGDTDINATVTVNAATFDDFGYTGGIGTSDLNIGNAGRLNVNLDNPAAAWRVLSNGIVNYNGDGTPGVFLDGNDIDLDGTLNVNGDGTSNARLIIGGTVNITTAEPLRLGTGVGIHELDGGTVNGPGNLVGNTNADLGGFGTINADLALAGTSGDLTAIGGTLEVNGSILDVGTLRAPFGGTLQLDQDFDTANSAGGISLTGGVVNGTGTATLSSQPLVGHGILIAKVVNDNTIRSSGGILILNSANHDLDGAGEAGVLHAQSGTLRVLNYNDTDTFNGVVQIDNGATLHSMSKELKFTNNAGRIDMNGGTYRADVDHNFQGDIEAAAGTILTTGGATFAFGAGAQTSLKGTLGLDGNTRLVGGTTILNTGSGTLHNLPGSFLRINNGVTVGALLDNDGDLQINDTGRGSTVLSDFDQGATGTLNIDVAGTSLVQFDRISVNGSALLDGTLDVDFTFTPAVGNTFAFLTTLSRTGTFDTLDITGLGAGLDAVVNYTSTAAILEIINAVTLTGDYNASGQVEQGDLDLVLNNWGVLTPPIPAGWTNDLPSGQIDQAELDKVLNNWGSTSAPDFAGSTVPEPAAVAALATLALLGRRRDR